MVYAHSFKVETNNIYFLRKLRFFSTNRCTYAILEGSLKNLKPFSRDFFSPLFPTEPNIVQPRFKNIRRPFLFEHQVQQDKIKYVHNLCNKETKNKSYMVCSLGTMTDIVLHFPYSTGLESYSDQTSNDRDPDICPRIPASTTEDV